MRYILTFLSTLVFVVCAAQPKVFNKACILSHNDYEQRVPFFDAYNNSVGYIEADVFLHDNTLLVAHTHSQLSPDRTLEGMYLKPIHEKISGNNGNTYADGKVLTLMIDLKTEGDVTLSKLVEILKKYPSLKRCRTLKFVISGNVPPPAQWKKYPSYIYFDGRPSITYTSRDLKRVAYISDSFANYASWNDGNLSDADLRKVKAVIAKVHQLNKPFRFWGLPDGDASWKFLMREGVDIIGTDHVLELIAFLYSCEP